MSISGSVDLLKSLPEKSDFYENEIIFENQRFNIIIYIISIAPSSESSFLEKHQNKHQHSSIIPIPIDLDQRTFQELNNW